MGKWLWMAILGYVFLRPFVTEPGFKVLASVLNGVLLISGSIYVIKKGIKLKSIDKVISVFLLSLLISIAFSDNFLKSLVEFYKYLPFIALFYIARVTDEDGRNRLNLALIISACLVCLFSLYYLFVASNFITEYLSNNTTYPFAYIFPALRRAFFPFITANLLANYLIMIIMLSLGLAVHKIKKGKKDTLFYLSISCLTLSFITLFFTKSVGGWAILIISIFIFLALGKMLDKKGLSALFLIFILLAAVFFIRMQTDDPLTKPTFSVHKRLSYWKETVGVIKKDPLTGIGIGNFFLKEARYAHNSYLQVWAEMGILGIISYLSLAFLFIKKGLENLRSEKAFYCNVGILSAGAAFILHNLIDFGFFVPEVAFLWWIMLGVTHKDQRFV